MTMIKVLRYVCGFIFSVSGSEVLLVRKEGPEWQQGKLNGIAGEIGVREQHEGATLSWSETPLETMTRVFDESVCCVSPDDPDVMIPFALQGAWIPFTMLAGNGWPGNEDGPMWVIHYFFNRADRLTKARSKTVEGLEVICLNELFKNCVPNLTWLVPLAQNFRRERAKMFTMCEHYTLDSDRMVKQMETVREKGGGPK